MVLRLYFKKGFAMKRNRQKRFGTFVCHCGCKQTFTAEYTTRAPQYLDRKHRNKKLAENKQKSREAKTKELFRLYKSRRAAFTKLGFKGITATRLAKALDDKDFAKLTAKIQQGNLGAKDASE